MPVPPKLVCIRWEDAKMLEAGPWCDARERTYEPHEVWQVGFITLDVPEGIHIVSAWHPDATSPPDQIPRAMIREIVELAPVASKRKR